MVKTPPLYCATCIGEIDAFTLALGKVVTHCDHLGFLGLHGFIKKDQKTPKPDLDLAKDRLKRMRGVK